MDNSINNTTIQPPKSSDAYEFYHQPDSECVSCGETHEGKGWVCADCENKDD